MNKVSENPLKNRELSWFAVATGLYITLYLAANVMSVRIFQLTPSICVDAGTLIFPFMYVVADIVNETWGYKMSKQLIFITFCSIIVFTLCTSLTLFLPYPEYLTDTAEAYSKVFTTTLRIVAGSIVGFLVGSFINAWVFDRIRRRLQGRHLWIRAMTSSVNGILFDTLPFTIIAFAGTVAWSDIFSIVLVNFGIKVAIELVAGTPLVYGVSAFFKKFVHRQN